MSTRRTDDAASQEDFEVIEQPQTFWKAILPVIACGAGLFSDGYINNVIGAVIAILAVQYGDLWKNSTAKTVLPAIAFAGTVVGQLVFGYLSDKWSRTNSLVLSTAILIIFTALTAGSYYHGDTIGMFNIMTAWRFFVSIFGAQHWLESDRGATGWYRNRWRIPSGICWMRRVHRGAQGRLEEHVVHSLHEFDDRLGIRLRCFRPVCGGRSLS